MAINNRMVLWKGLQMKRILLFIILLTSLTFGQSASTMLLLMDDGVTPIENQSIYNMTDEFFAYTDFLAVPNNSRFLGNGSFTAHISFFSTDTNHYNYLFACRTLAESPNNKWYVKMDYDGTYFVRFVGEDGTGGDIYGVDTLMDGTWHHLTMVVDRNIDTLKVYVDGVFDKARGIGGTTHNTSDSLYIGNLYRGYESNSQTFEGYLDNFYYYNKALTATEVAELYTVTSADVIDKNLYDNLEVWYAGDMGLTSSGWLDQSGNKKDLRFNHANWTPNLTNTKNGIKTALFDGTTDRSDSVLFTTTSWTIYAVVMPITHTNYDYFCDGGVNARAGINQGTSEGILRLSSSNVQASANLVPLNTWAIIVGQVESVGDGQDIWIQINDNEPEGGTANGNPDAGGFKLGSNYNSTAFGNFEVVEIRIYDEFHDATKIANQVNYLNARYVVY